MIFFGFFPSPGFVWPPIDTGWSTAAVAPDLGGWGTTRVNYDTGGGGGTDSGATSDGGSGDRIDGAGAAPFIAPDAINVLIRGQSNAWLFADRGGADALEADLEARLGVGVNILASYGEADSTIHSATPFMTWDTEGQQDSMLRFLASLPAEVKDNPTITVWMHNEYDQQGSFRSAEWVNEVRIDAALVRDALGQGAGATPYVFEYVPYGWGGNGEAIRDGMATLAADRSFNASIGPSINDLAMDGDGNVGAHMSDADVRVVADRLGEALPAIAAPLLDGGAGLSGGHGPGDVSLAQVTAFGAWDLIFA